MRHKVGTKNSRKVELKYPATLILCNVRQIIQSCQCLIGPEKSEREGQKKSNFKVTWGNIYHIKYRQ